MRSSASPPAVGAKCWISSDRKSTRLNSSHSQISYAVFCLTKKDTIDKLERSLTTLADVVTKEFRFDYRNEPGADAAGGLRVWLLSFCVARNRPSFDVVAAF